MGLASCENSFFQYNPAYFYEAIMVESQTKKHSQAIVTAQKTVQMEDRIEKASKIVSATVRISFLVRYGFILYTLQLNQREIQ